MGLSTPLESTCWPTLRSPSRRSFASPSEPRNAAHISTSPSEIASLLASRRLSLSARRARPATIATDSSAVFLLADYLAAHGMPTGLERVRREQVAIAWSSFAP
jgi:hypothetical protein